jgi:hypothetical protein
VADKTSTTVYHLAFVGANFGLPVPILFVDVVFDKVSALSFRTDDYRINSFHKDETVARYPCWPLPL